MSVIKTLLIATGLIFGLATLAQAGPRTFSQGYNASTDIPGNAQQDRFAITN
jgi:hypothetical protein